MEAFCCYLDQNVSIFIRFVTIHQSVRSVFDAGSAPATGAMSVYLSKVGPLGTTKLEKSKCFGKQFI